MSAVMHSSRESADSETWSQLKTLHATNYIMVAAPTFYVYDCLLTFPREVRYIWQHKISLAGVLFLISRYTTLCANVLGLVQLVSWDDNALGRANKTCAVVFRIMDVTNILAYLAFILFVSVRTYAIWDRNRVVFSSLLLLGLLYPLWYTYYVSRRKAWASLPPAIGCEVHFTLPKVILLRKNTDHIFQVLGAVIAISFELLAMILTWIKTVYVVRQFKRPSTAGWHVARSLAKVMLYDGALMFVVIFIANILDSILLKSLVPLNITTQSITSLLVARFILDLREEYVANMNSGGDSVSLHITDTPDFGVKY